MKESFVIHDQSLSATPEFVNEARFGKSLDKHTMGADCQGIQPRG